MGVSPTLLRAAAVLIVVALTGMAAAPGVAMGLEAATTPAAVAVAVPAAVAASGPGALAGVFCRQAAVALMAIHTLPPRRCLPHQFLLQFGSLVYARTRCLVDC